MNNKGIIFALDATVAAFLIIGAIIFSYALMNKESVLPYIQVIRTGSDVLALLDNEGILNDAMEDGEFETEDISEAIEDILPSNYEIRLEIILRDASLLSDTTTAIGPQKPTDRFIGAGKRFFVIKDEGGDVITHFGVARYWVWLK